MSLLENFLDNVNEIYKDLNYKDFGYDDEEIFDDELNFLLENVYNIKVLKSKRKRLRQQEWANKIRMKFNNSCVISGVNESYLESCHLVEVKDCEDYNENNGILLTKNLHTQFDNQEFGINPNNYCIEIKENTKGDIYQYNGKKLNLPNNYIYKSYLEERYNQFLKN